MALWITTTTTSTCGCRTTGHQGLVRTSSDCITARAMLPRVMRSAPASQSRARRHQQSSSREAISRSRREGVTEQEASVRTKDGARRNPRPVVFSRLATRDSQLLECPARPHRELESVRSAGKVELQHGRAQDPDREPGATADMQLVRLGSAFSWTMPASMKPTAVIAPKSPKFSTSCRYSTLAASACRPVYRP